MKIKVITKYVLIALVLAVFVCCGSAAADNKFYVDTTGITQPIPYDSTTTIPVMVTSTEGFAGFKVYVYNSDSSVSIQINTSLSEEEALNGMYTINNEQNPLVATFANSKDISSGTKTAFYVDVTPSLTAKEAKIDFEIVEVKKVSGDVTNSFAAEDCILSVQKAPLTATSIKITAPTASSLAYGDSGVATATVLDQYGDEMKDAKITWTATEGITIDAAGNYKVVSSKAGSATITAAIGEISDSVAVTLTKATLTADDFITTPELKSYEWTGEPMAVTVKAKDGVTGVGVITVSYNGNAAVPEDKGTYKVTISVAEGDNYLAADNLELGTLTITGTIIYAPTLGTFPTYNGKEQTIALVDSVNSAGKYTVSGNTGTDAGTYTLTLALNDPDNAEWDKGGENGVLNLKWEILPKSVADAEITVGEALVFNGAEQIQTFIVKLDETTLVAGTDYTIEGDKATEAGDYTATITGIGNYAGKATASWKMKGVPTAADVTCVIPTDVVYDGKAHELTAKAADGVSGLGAITLLYNNAEAAPVAAGTYKVNASIAAGENYVAETIELGEFTINKATLTKDDLTFTPVLPVSYEAGSAEAVVVTVKEGILGNGTVTVKYGDVVALPTTAGIYKVNATFAEGTNYTVADICLGDMTIVTKVVPNFGDIGVANANGSQTIIGIQSIDETKNTTILESNDVQIVIAFSDMMKVSATEVVGNITSVAVIYPEMGAASPKAGEFKYNLTINLGNKLTSLLPNITSVYDLALAEKVKPSGKTFAGLVMVTATGDNVDDINANITAGNGYIDLVFKIPKTAVSAADKGKIVVYHVSGDKVTRANFTPAKEEGDYYLVTVTGSGFSSYVAGIENDVSSGSTGGGSAGILIPSSSKTPTTVTPPEVPVDPETPSDDPGDVPSEIPGTTPSEPGKSPAPVAGMILGALAAAAVLRRK